MDQDPLIENEVNIAKRIEDPESAVDKGIEMLESPPEGNFVTGLSNFISWIQSLVGKKD
jgi:hypothetical protein